MLFIRALAKISWRVKGALENISMIKLIRKKNHPHSRNDSRTHDPENFAVVRVNNDWQIINHSQIRPPASQARALRAGKNSRIPFSGIFAKIRMFNPIRTLAIIRGRAKRVFTHISMKRRRLFKLLTVTITILVTLAVTLRYFSSPTSAVWYDDNWTYRVPITITHNAAVSNSKVKFDIDTSTLITAGKMQSDCGDSRFTDANGNLLRYYIDTSGGACNTTSTDYYVLIPTIINGTTITYHYYGNPSAANGTEAAQFSESTTTPSGSYTSGSEQKTRGPAAYWKLDEGISTTLQDSTLNDVDGTITGADWENEDLCLSGKCLFFDGNDQVVRASEKHSVDLGGTSDSYTVSAWVRTGKDFTSAVGYIVAKYDNTGSPNNYPYALYLDTSEYGCFAISDATNSPSSCGSTALNDNKWHLLTGVRSVSDDKIYIYVDGIQINSATDSTTATAANNDDVSIGNGAASYASGDFTGFIDEVKIYKYARSAAQVKLDYNSKNAASAKGAGTILGAQSLSALSHGLVGWWKMDENSWVNDCSTSTVTDSSGNGNNGKACPNSTGPTGGAAGKFGNGGSFDGSNDYVLVSRTAILEPSLITVSCWVKFNSFSSNHQLCVTKEVTAGGANSYALGVLGTTNKPIWVIAKSDGTESNVQGTALSTATWYQLSGTYDGTNMNLYVNGVLDASSAPAITIGYSSSFDTDIGAEPGASAWYVNGSIDDVRIYNRALSSFEVRALYNSAPGLRGHWKMEETSANTCSGGVNDSCDSSGNAFDGAWNGNATSGIGKFGGGVTFDGTGDYVDAGDIGL